MISDNYQPTRDLGNGVTTAFAFSFNIIATANIRVYLEAVTGGAQTLQVNGSDYTLVWTSSGGTVTFITAPASTYYVIIAREIPNDQTVPYTTSAGFQGSVVEDSLDKLTAQIQDTAEGVERSPKFPIGSTSTPNLPSPESGKVLGYDTSLDFENKTITPDGLVVAASDSKKILQANLAGDGVEFVSKDSFAGFLSVLDYGAVGDGSTDDTAAVTAALAQASTLGGATIYFPNTAANQYKVESVTVNVAEVTFKSAKGVTLIPVSTSYSAGTKMFNVTANNVSFEDIEAELGHNTGTIAAGTTFNYPEHFVYFDSVTSPKVKNCKTTDGQYSFYFERCSDVHFVGNIGTSNERWFQYCEGLTRGNVSQNTCSLSAYDGFKFGAATTDTGTEAPITDLVFTGNIAHDNLKDGLDFAVDGADNCVIDGNIFTDNSVYGIEVKHSALNTPTNTAKKVIISNNVVNIKTGVAYYGILLRQENGAVGVYEDCQIVGNNITGADVANNLGVWIGDATRCLVSGNIIKGCKDGILVGNGEESLVEGNVITACDRCVVVEGTGTDNNIVRNNFLKNDGNNHVVSVLTGTGNRVYNNEITLSGAFYTVFDENSPATTSSASSTAVFDNLTGTDTSTPTGKGRPGDLIVNRTQDDGEVQSWVATTHSTTAATWSPRAYIGAIPGAIGLQVGVSAGSSYLNLEPNAVAFNRAGNSYLEQRDTSGQVRIRTSSASAGDTDNVAFTNDAISTFFGVVKLTSYTVATVPSVTAGGIIYVSDETGGAVLAFSDGTNWRRVTDRAIVS